MPKPAASTKRGLSSTVAQTRESGTVFEITHWAHAALAAVQCSPKQPQTGRLNFPVASFAANALYGVHFETAAERRWRLRPPVEERARSKAQRVVGNIVDSLVANEHEAAHGWKLSK